jgi:hypothetical protein
LCTCGVRAQTVMCMLVQGGSDGEHSVDILFYACHTWF